MAIGLDGIWAMEPGELRTLVARIAAATPGADPAEPDRRVEVINGVAQIPIRGPIMPRSSWIDEILGIEVASVARIRADLEHALANPAVRSIALLVDSPGGQVAGVDDLAAEIRSAGKRKPVVAVVEGGAASAAYWLAAQAGSISAPRTATIGSIGVYAVVVDSSAAAEGEGLKVHLLRSGPDKGVGVPGVPISDEQLATLQEQIDAVAEIFQDAVAKGRGLPKAAVRKLATGRTWIGSAALEHGLIDSIESSSVALSRAGKGMAMDQVEELQAKVAELQSSVGTLTAAVGKLSTERDEALAALEARAKREQDEIVGRCRDHVQALGPTPKLQRDIARVEKFFALGEHDEARAAAGDILATERVVNGRVVPRPADDRPKDFLAEAKRLAEERKIELGAAITALARENPELHRAWLQSQSQGQKKAE